MSLPLSSGDRTPSRKLVIPANAGIHCGHSA